MQYSNIFNYIFAHFYFIRKAQGTGPEDQLSLAGLVIVCISESLEQGWVMGLIGVLLGHFV